MPAEADMWPSWVMMGRGVVIPVNGNALETLCQRKATLLVPAGRIPSLQTSLHFEAVAQDRALKGSARSEVLSTKTTRAGHRRCGNPGVSGL
jgi:hypothetical protein